MRFWASLPLLAVAGSVSAQAPVVNVESAVFIERDETAGRLVEPAADFRKGERIVTVMRWDAPGGNYTVTSPIPRTLQFERASIDTVQVSTDGGRTWRTPEAVQPEAVTHLRWRARGAGRLSYSAIVR